MIKRINVAVGVLFNADGKVLVGQRTVKDRYFKKWEFPGGKLEVDESAKQALIRELKEELGVDVQQCSELMTVEHNYPDRQVRLYVQLVNVFDGVVQSREGQALKWVELEELEHLDFLQGNQPIIERLSELHRSR